MFLFDKYFYFRSFSTATNIKRQFIDTELEFKVPFHSHKLDSLENRVCLKKIVLQTNKILAVYMFRSPTGEKLIHRSLSSRHTNLNTPHLFTSTKMPCIYQRRQSRAFHTPRVICYTLFGLKKSSWLTYIPSQVRPEQDLPS